MAKRETLPLTRRILAGISIAMASAAACGLFAIFAYVVDGGDSGRKLKLGRILGTYAVAAVSSGTILGIVRPIATNWIGKVIASIAIAWPVAVMMVVFYHNGRIEDVTRGEWIATCAIAAVIGPIGAAYYHLSGRRW